MAPSLVNAYKALTELGPGPLALNGLYRFGLATGHYRRTLEQVLKQEEGAGGMHLEPVFHLPKVAELEAALGEEEKATLIAEADEIAAGRVRLFGGELVELRLAVDGPLADWSTYERGKARVTVDGRRVEDIKFAWEPARFGWVFVLGRAYRLTGEERYAETFWRNFEEFMGSNPPYRGPQWTSGQEAAIRMMAFAWAGQIFAGGAGSTPGRMTALAQAIALHARRIPPTLVYARSQQNNHLLTEAAGLYTAGLVLSQHAEAGKWRKLGWQWLNRGLQEQIDGYGEYAQHSANYHRLMLQVVLWVHALKRGQELRWPRKTNDAIVRSIHWLLALLDHVSGRVPNLGANDGAYLFPLSVCLFEDYRPVLNAAARAFLEYDLPHGPWDEMSLWFGIPLRERKYVSLPRYLGDQMNGKESWACLRTAQFKTRPSHADQLHLDLWRGGENITLDAGTYRYTADAPWDNALAAAQVHNTITVNRRDQMTRAGRFLYVDWVNAYRQGTFEVDPTIVQRVRGRYRNYHQGYRHTRLVTVFADERWRVEDAVLPLRWMPLFQRRLPLQARLHWLLPDWEWEAGPQEAGFELRLKSIHGEVVLKINSPSSLKGGGFGVSLVRAGEKLFGEGPAEPVRGWVSPTYGIKQPALSLAVESTSIDEVQFVSEFLLKKTGS